MLAACGRESPTRQDASELGASSAGAAAENVITLITGDRVSVRTVDGGRALALVTPGPGRAHLAFAVREEDREITVIPQDAQPLVSAGQLDRALFNVTRLLADGFGDADLDHLPLILTGASAAQGLASQLTTAGVSIERTFPSLGMIAARHAKGSGAALLPALTKAAAGGTAPGKLWLDRRLKLSLDRSVPQIGAPAAQARGLTGAGVKVAVLDTGVDATHPDLVGKVVLAASFVNDSAGDTDPHGHGTHVASTIAGSGAGGGGLRRGVAPGASLMSGQVCLPSGGCPESAVLAGMEWAAANGAQIVNMSLGSPDSPELDPLEAAIDQLSAQHGTLFVVAAGNFGGAPRTVDSPSTADAALSVGAVDSRDRLAAFSGQGPRIGDNALKPDLTAPGVGVVAARATGTTMGAPVDSLYTRASGTSMATPHVAGAAALLLQQHPDWSGQTLKAALMSAASPNAASPVFAQGAGRLDIDRATRQALVAEPGSLSLGTASYPHDDDPPIVQTVRYHNYGAAPITVALTASLASARAGIEPAGMISVTPASLVVPAGGTAQAEVTVNPRVEGPDDSYGGALVAASDGVLVRTPIGLEREGAAHELTVGVLGPDGQPGEAEVSLVGLGSPSDPAYGVRIDSTVFGQATFRLPAGTYLVEGADFQNDVIVLAPRVALTDDATVTLDATLAKPVAFALPEPGYSVAQHILHYVDSSADLGAFWIFPGTIATAQIGAAAAPGELSSGMSVTMAPAEVPVRSVYHLASSFEDRFPTGWSQTFTPRDFARVRSEHAGPPGRLLAKITAAYPLRGGVTAAHGFAPVEGPFQRTDYYYGPDHLWYGDLREGFAIPGLPDHVNAISIVDGMAEYHPGQRYRESWNQAPFGPGFAARTLLAPTGDLVGAPQRFRNFLVLVPSLFGDQAVPSRNGGSRLDEGSLKLFRDGRLFGEATHPAPLRLFPVMPPERATYRLEVAAKRPPDLFELSPEVQATWTFQAEGGAQNLRYPLPMLRFQPELDRHNRTGARAMLLPIQIERPFGAPTPEISSLEVEVSFDDGATWSRMPVWRHGATAIGFVLHPRDASYVSLRGSASDVEGNAVEQTIIRAYALR